MFVEEPTIQSFEATLVSGKPLALAIRENVKRRVLLMDRTPGLATILVGDNAASHTYIKLKGAAAKEAGIHFEKQFYPANATTAELIQAVQALNAREDIHGILVQFPLPEQDEDAIVAAIHPDKDVDGFHPANRARRAEGAPSLVPPVMLGVMHLLRATEQSLRGRIAVVISNSPIFAEPMLVLLKQEGVTAAYRSPEALDVFKTIGDADVVIVAVGRAGFITKEMIKAGAMVVDIGANSVNGKVCGDVCPSVREKASYVTPVPGGVGPLTVAYLIQNVVQAYEMQHSHHSMIRSESSCGVLSS
ncbi:hypothetical protein A3C17_00725 [Candidatus Uhrbacteria bacterium RIFCSPHIGHO2_02_FULL_53_13]|uniref:Bifunctional protein FolD n=2 Tax=Candidatus Uhriibacteriota TaxID=1752732 RepID=A0A1F7TYF1_9BACT|nr:MAG: hypothetical protein A3C17_00725 [Candidatus Uhrbacteria bacterium RIFCSPHIGHO2_02_FULL_53_13]OGL90329.1 MAG: hypothetical protein A3I45_02675 [Candidatus Uhrbacteria bacterium RIFCSPLOWO2_02_FULL_53_10]